MSGTGGYLRCITVILLCAHASAGYGARLFVDSRPTNIDPKDQVNRLIFRELPRQAIIVSATQDFGATCIDPTVEPNAKAHDGDAIIGLDRKVNSEQFIITVSLWDSKNQSLGSFDIPQKANENSHVYLDDYAARCDEITRVSWRPILIKQLGAQPMPPKWDPSLPAPEQVDRLLATIDFQHAFLAARLTHQAIRDSGESPARLGALVRAYAHLGDATRHLPAAQSIGFLARSLMYAQRLVRLAPDSAMAWRYRAYAEAMAGLVLAGQADLKHAAELPDDPANPAPAWVKRISEMLAFDTIGLIDKAGDRETGPLAVYFAWMTIEHSTLRSLPIRFGQLAMEQNPGALRVHDAIGANAGVGLNHQVTSQASQVLNRLVASLATEPAAPKSVQDPVRDAVQARFAVSSILKLLAELDALPEEPAQPIQWSTYVSMVRECQFVNAVRRLSFVAYAWSVDPTAEREGWINLCSGHRYADLLESFQPPRQPVNPRIAAKVSAIDWKDDSMSADLVIAPLTRIGLTKDPRLQVSWAARQRRQSGNTAYDIAQSLWRYRYSDMSDPKFRDFCRTEARFLNAVCPDHPLALMVLLITDWPAMQNRAAQLEQTATINPLVAYGLGCAYAADKNPQARRFLEIAARFAPEREVYQRLAETFLADKDEVGWLKTWDEYLRVSDDFGLDHAKACEQIAYHLLAAGDPRKALKYAQQSAQSGSEWGMNVHSTVLIRLHEYDQAAAVMQDNAERYGRAGPFYRFVRMSGRGDLNAARQSMAPTIPAAVASTQPAVVRDAAVYYRIEGEPFKAIDLMKKVVEMEKNPFNAILLSTLYIEQKEPDAARAILQTAARIPAANDHDKAYLAAVAEVLRCLNDPAAIPSRDGELGILASASGQQAAQRGNICYCIGQIAETNGHKEDALWWYRTALDADSPDFTCRALAAIAMRNLGEEYYK